MKSVYVAPGIKAGKGDGSASKPIGWADLQKYINKLAFGDEIVVNDGEYSLSGQLTLRTAGVTMRARTRHGAHLVGPAVGSMLDRPNDIWHGLVANAADVTLSGLLVKNIPYNGIYAAGRRTTIDDLLVYDCGKSRASDKFGGQGIMIGGSADDSKVTNTEVYGCKEHAIYAGGAVNRVTVDSCNLHECGFGADGTPSDQAGNNAGASGLQINGSGNPARPHGSKGIKFTNNRVWGHTSRGILILCGSDGEVSGNTVYGNGMQQVSLSMGSNRNIVRGNQVYSGVRECFHVSNGGNYGPSAANQLLGNLLYCFALKFPCIPIALDDILSVKSSGSNRIHTAESYIATIGSVRAALSDWQTLAADKTSYQGEFPIDPVVRTYFDATAARAHTS